MVEYYVDVAFVINFFLDYILLLLCRYVRHRSVERKRVIFGAVILAAATVISEALELANTYQLLFHVLISYFVCLFVFRGKGGVLIKDYFCFWGISFLFGGSLSAAKNAGILLFGWKKDTAALFAGIPLSVLFLYLFMKEKRGEELNFIYPVSIHAHGICVSGNGLLDSGNRLFDPFSGKPVMLCDEDKMKEIVQYAWEKSPQSLRFIPYQSVGKKDGVLLCVTVDEIEVNVRNGVVRQEHVLVAVAEHISETGEYQMILHPDFM